MRFWLPVLVAVAVIPASAHHPFTPYYDASRPTSITGVIAELRLINPHVVLIVEGRGPDGRIGRWAFEGSSPNALQQQGTKNLRQRLKVGTKLTISGWPAKDPKARAFSGREITFADGSTMIFGPTPEGGDGWHCSTDPCRYKYPDVASP